VAEQQTDAGGIQPNPHKVPWFFKLLRLDRLIQHPTADDDGDDPQGQWRSALDVFSQSLMLPAKRAERYRIFKEMDSGLVASILDLYAEEVTQMDYDTQQTVWAESKASHITKAAMECLGNIMVEDGATAVTRRTAQYGEAFQRLVYEGGKGVLAWRDVKGEQVFRVDDRRGRLIGFKQDGQKFREKKRVVSWPWDYVHFRLLAGNSTESGTPEGTSLLDAMFRPWRALTIMEDATTLYRIRRTPDRNLIMIDVGEMEEHDAQAQVARWRKTFKKAEHVDPASPDYRKQFNPVSPLEDIFLPMRGGDAASRVETLSGSGDIGQSWDLEHTRNTFFGSSKVPKAYLGFEGDINAKATLMQQDVRFARSAKRIRRSQIVGYRRVIDVHLSLLEDGTNGTKYDPLETDNAYVVMMPPISYLDEWERLQLVQLRYQIVSELGRLAQDMQMDPRVWAIYVMLTFAKLPEELVLKLIAKTPDEPMGAAGGGGQFEGVDMPDVMREWMAKPGNRKAVFGAVGVQGYTALSDKEQVEVARMMHRSPQMRKLVGDLAFYYEDEAADGTLVESVQFRQLRQIDSTTLPPRTGGKALVDCVADDPEAKRLTEDLASVKTGVPLSGVESVKPIVTEG
jgi:hypothetical protein